jgi:methyl-accepting chemotaxis protein
MTIGKKFKIVSAVGFTLVVLLAVTIALAFKNQQDLNRSQQVRYQSYLAANELRMSSENLTRLARTYVVSGEPQYESQYWDILDVRNGKKPRPDGTTKSLRSIMQDLGFTENEFGKLKEAEQNSNSLVTTETIAMNAVKGLYDDGAGHYTKKAAPDLEMARRIMHDQKYHKDKELIMKPIEEFFTMLDQRTESAVKTEVFRGNLLLMIIGMLALGTAASLFYIVKSSRAVLKQITDQLYGTIGKASELTVEMRDASQSVSQIASKQAAGVQETVATLSEISAMAERTLGNAKKSSETADAGKATAEQCRQSVEEMTVSIREIDASSEQIVQQVDEGNKKLGEIIQIISDITNKTKVINDIVFQTKLLSFNASVEAARAGESGKGFAVVAEEVGNLAQLSGKSSKEISDLLAGSISKVESIIQETSQGIQGLVNQAKSKVQKGTEIAQRCESSLGEVVRFVGDMSMMMSEITQASVEQAKGVNEITSAMHHLDKATAENSSMAAHTADCAKNLETNTSDLSSLVNGIETDILGIKSDGNNTAKVA